MSYYLQYRTIIKIYETEKSYSPVHDCMLQENTFLSTYAKILWDKNVIT